MNRVWLIMTFLLAVGITAHCRAETIITKDAKRQAKELRKGGWKTMPGDKSLELLIAESQELERQVIPDTTEAIPRYMFETSWRTASSPGAAISVAQVAARSFLAVTISRQVAAATQMKIQNGDDGTSEVEMKRRINNMTDVAISNAFVVFALYRKLPDGNYEAMVRLAIDRQTLNLDN